jgi:hypothetical protein
LKPKSGSIRCDRSKPRLTRLTIREHVTAPARKTRRVVTVSGASLISTREQQSAEKSADNTDHDIGKDAVLAIGTHDDARQRADMPPAVSQRP